MKKLMKVAYKTPPQENWNFFRDETQCNENFITDEHYARLAEAGFTHGLALLEHGADVAKRALAMAEKYGLQYYVRDEINWANILHKDFYYLNGDNYRAYQQSPAFAGIYVCDEPNADKYPALQQMVQGYYDFFGTIGEPLVNLLPTYANDVEQLGAASYEEYIERYAQQVPTDYLLYDHYPFRYSSKGEWRFHDDYLHNAQVVASACKRHGKELRAFVQACDVDENGGALMEEMLSMQVHTHLAFGAKALVYYYYWGGLCSKNDGIVTEQGKPTPIYDAVKKLHAQVARYEEALMECTWEKTLFVKGGVIHHNEKEFAREDCSANGIVQADYDCIVGVLSYRGETAYYLVNYVNPLLALQNKIRVKFDREYQAFFAEHTGQVCDECEIVLRCGVGVFFLPKA